MFRHVLIALSCAILLAGCKNRNKNTENVPQDKVYNIGVAKIIAHPALDAIEKGLTDELEAQGITNVTYDFQSANGEFSTAGSIANKFRSNKVDIAVGIATPMALSLANAIKDRPVVFSAVTDPVDAGLRKTNGVENTNITGVSDASPIREQIELMNSVKPLKTLGHIYNAGEANSVAILGILEEVCDDMGIELVVNTVTNTSEVKQAAEVMGSKKVDAIYVSTDNVVAAAIQSVTTTAARYKIPVIGADPVTAENSGALLAYGVDYYIAGRQTGKIIADIIRGANPGDIPVKYMTASDELQLYADENVAAELGIDVSKLID